MDWAGINEAGMKAVKAAHKAGLPHIAFEIYSVLPVRSERTFSNLIERAATVKTLLKLRPPTSREWSRCSIPFEALFTEIEVTVQSRQP